jgi:hypothetical protein
MIGEDQKSGAGLPTFSETLTLFLSALQDN